MTISDQNRVLSLRKAQTITGYLVTGLEEKTDALSKDPYLFGWSWEPEPNGRGCLGPCRWNRNGSVRAESLTELTDWVDAK